MAQKRMIDKKISVSEQVANLPVTAQLIYTWSVPHADDIGLLPSSHRTLKATICPLLDLALADFDTFVTAIRDQGLWETYDYQGQMYYRLTNFIRYQTLKKDRQPQILLPIELDSDPRKTWVKLKKLGFQMEDFGFQMEPEVKRSEEKGSKEKIRVLGDAPAKVNKEFFDQGPGYYTLLDKYSEKVERSLAEIEFKKFVLYWTEPNKSGTKVKWEQQPTFDVERRLYTWFSRVKDRRRTGGSGRGLA